MYYAVPTCSSLSTQEKYSKYLEGFEYCFFGVRELGHGYAEPLNEDWCLNWQVLLQRRYVVESDLKDSACITHNFSEEIERVLV